MTENDALCKQSHVQWEIQEGKAVATMLDGRSIFEWKAEYNELAARFVEYADHTAACYSARDGHEHTHLTDDRIVCRLAPCTCGLLIILGVLNPTIMYGIECPDDPTPRSLPVRTRPSLNPDGTQLHIFGIPVVETDADAPDNIIVLESMPKPTDNGY